MSVARWRVLAVLLLLGLWGSIVSQALFFAQTPRTPLAVLISPELPILGRITGGMYIYQEGIIYGAVQGLRSAAMLSLGLFVCWTSDPRQLLQALIDWKLPPQIACMLVTAIRFLPVLAAETGEIWTALRLRRADRKQRLFFLRNLRHIAKPLLARSLRRAHTLALSLVSRGFFLAKAGGEKQGLWPVWEKVGCGIGGTVVILAAASKIAYLLSEQGWYIGMLRQIYDGAKLYL